MTTNMSRLFPPDSLAFKMESSPEDGVTPVLTPLCVSWHFSSWAGGADHDAHPTSLPYLSFPPARIPHMRGPSSTHSCRCFGHHQHVTQRPIEALID